MTTHEDQPLDNKDRREAKIGRTEDGPVGAALYITPEELEELGIDPEKTDSVVIRIEDGALTLRSSNPT